MHLAVVFIDLDGFKKVNDQHGHGVGDKLLSVLSRRMTQVLREGDTLARLGGDEFVAILVDLPDISISVPILDRLIEVAAQPVPIGDALCEVSASIGVSYYPQGEDIDADQLLRQADRLCIVPSKPARIDITFSIRRRIVRCAPVTKDLTA